MEKVCIVCPRGCMLHAEEHNGQLEITNNGCSRGPEYLKQELVAPKRMLTTTVKVNGGSIPVVPVYAEEYVDKDDVQSFVEYLKQIELQAPIDCNQLVVSEINGKTVKIYTSRCVDKC